ncbi:hypothetical protein N5U20_10740 [Aliarcobacter butzleri]|uniref:hypothetical protein n=1 Tax=Arcobacteraceae TaxID=2808963 RepID=UPI0021B1DEF1|nr:MULTISPECIES: hypothetical protein [Arcobacteraceae]MCT7564258.1 hypothetical protein [Aliarcobacter butzleri]MCT7613678.1 hypothetical protein [Aliarcobacter butzleri]MCT7642255.1 hypothetical protein [Aliarcobacter butzleri]MCT7912173.1 hypothetical protein [Arcobacter lacus]
MEKELLINGKKLKEIVSKALNLKYENLSIEYNDEPELVVEIKYGHFVEQIPFSNEKILNELNLREFNLELDYVSIYENEYAYSVDATDEQRVYLFICKEREMGA